MMLLDIVLGIIVGYLAFLICGAGLKMGHPWPIVIGVLIGVVVATLGLAGLGITIA